MMEQAHLQLAERLKAFVHAFAGKASVSRCKIAFCGFHSDLIAALSLSIVNEVEAGSGWYGPHARGQPMRWERVYQEAVARLLWVATPEVACTLLQDPAKQRKLLEENGVDVSEVYFKTQSHSNLPTFVERMREVRREGKPRLTQLMTYSPLFLGAATILQTQVRNTPGWPRSWANFSLF